MRIIALTLLALLLCSCGKVQTSYKVVMLPTGKEVKVAGMGRINFTKDEPALMLKYYTDLEINNATSIETEVLEIWEGFRKDVEAAKLTSGIVSANDMPKGMIHKGTMRNYVFKRKPDGKWELVAKPSSQQATTN
ncbi:MAG: hypothetical protein HYV36_01065 [Lentisphaerae bacterium]|nr:hypothetical protein [Lentisphaerota bacterium]